MFCRLMIAEIEWPSFLQSGLNRIVCMMTIAFGVCLHVDSLGPVRAYSGEVQLKNGMILRGNMWKTHSLGGRPVGATEKPGVADIDPVVRNILIVANGWQKYYVPIQQVPGANFDVNASIRPFSFSFKHIKRNQNQAIASVGSVRVIKPFDQFGVRTVEIETVKGPVQVTQGITQIEPDHVVVEGLNHKWKIGLSLKSIPFETINQLVHSQIKSDDATARLGLVAFFRQAEYFPEAFAELDEVEKAFPEHKDRCDLVRAELIDQWGREVLKQLMLRRRAGQHELAVEFARKLSTQQLGGAVLEDVRTFLRDYELSNQKIEKAKNLLVDWQAKVKSPEILKLLQPLRSEISEQLDFETISRLDAFLSAEADTDYSPEQRLSLAYSGWVLGAARSITDLEKTVRIWEARYLVSEYCRAESVQDANQLYDQITRLEGIGPELIRQIAELLPPPLDVNPLLPGEPSRIRMTPEGHTPELGYLVSLPLEYSPHHEYPMVVVLNGRGTSREQTIRWWCGSEDEPGPALRRGYIVIAPEYIEDDTDKYTYNAASHHAVIEAIRDARRRFSIDSDRVFLAGQGRGADAAFDLGMAHPDEFAGVIPIGGHCNLYPRFTYENGRYTSWYVVGRGFDDADQRDPLNNGLFDEIFKRGAKFDFMLVEYLGRGSGRFLEEIPRVFDWMDLHRRQAPPKEIKVESLRKTDNRFFWGTCIDLPRTTVLSDTTDPGGRINPMSVELRTTPGNVIYLKSAGKRYEVRFSPDLVDYSKRVTVKVGDKQEFKDFITPDSQATLQELRLTGDRKRLPIATLQF